MVTLKTVRRALEAAGITAADIAELVRNIKADAWDKGALWAATECGAIPSERTKWLATGDNPYRDVAPEPSLLEVAK